MKLYNIFVIIAIIVKIIYISLRLIIVSYSRPGTKKGKKLQLAEEIATKLEFIFTILMSCLLMYAFCAFYKKNNILKIDQETRILFFTFGVILIISADWNILMTTSITWKDIQSIVS
jgi:hypothetical protein